MKLNFREVTRGLRFPEGPIAMADGSVLVVEIEGARLTRVLPDGTKQTVAELGGGPNGAAIGPDGACYVCNNGGFHWFREGGGIRPGPQPAAEPHDPGRQHERRRRHPAFDHERHRKAGPQSDGMRPLS